MPITAALLDPCRYCSAAPLEPCTSPEGPVAFLHVERFRLFD